MKKMFSITIAAVTLLSILPPVFACSWDYNIWQNRNKNADALYRFIKNGKAGYIDKSGKIVVKPTFEAYGNYDEGFFDGYLKASFESSYFNLKGEKTFREFDASRDFSEGLAAVIEKDGEKWGYIDTTGRYVISPRFEDSVGNFSEGLAMIESGNLSGYINRSGDIVITPQFVDAKEFNDGMARVIVEGPCLYYDLDAPCSETVTIGGPGKAYGGCKFSFINKFGRLIPDAEFDDARDFSEGLAAVMIEGKWGYIDKAGGVVIKPAFERAHQFSNGRAAVSDGKYWGYIDKKGAIAIPIQYEWAYDFSDGLAPVIVKSDEGKNETYHFIRTSGKRAFAGDFRTASHYFKGIAHVRFLPQNEDDEVRRFAYIDTKGKMIFTYERGEDDND